MLDLLITDGQVVDGTGRAAMAADVAVLDGRVVEIGKVTRKARHTIDAGGRVVCPGFIDVHTHLDVQGFWDRTLSPSPLHGVTTAIGGNCGFTVAPIDDSSADYMRRMLARVEGMPLESLEQGVAWDWTSTEEYLSRLDRGLAINTGFLVGHSAIRRLVMGAEANERAAHQHEVEAMKELLRRGISAGCLGLSSTWAANHSDHDGRPVPSRLATAEELFELSAVVGEFEGTSLEFLPDSFVQGPFNKSLTETMIGMSLAAQRPLNWNVLTVDAKSLPEALQKLEVGDLARKRGAKVVALAIPVHPPAFLSIRSGYVLDVVPELHDFFFLPPADRLAVLKDPVGRQEFRLCAEKTTRYAHLVDWKTRYIQETFTPGTKKFEKRSVGDIAAEVGRDPFDVFIDIVVADDLLTRFSNPPPNSTSDDWQAQVQVWADDRAIIGGSDAGAHLDMLSTFAYTTTVLENAVRRFAVMSVEEAVRQMTSVPADLYGLIDRGRIKPGAIADLVIFDEASVAVQPVETKFDLPADAGRLYAEPEGIGHVIVAGVEISKDGEFTGAFPGRVLKSGQDTRTPALDSLTAEAKDLPPMPDPRGVFRSSAGLLPDPSPRERSLTVISVDDHVVEPPHTFEGRLPLQFRDRAPRIVQADDGAEVWEWEGTRYPQIAIGATAGRPKDEWSLAATRFSDIRAGCYDPAERIKDIREYEGG